MAWGIFKKVGKLAKAVGKKVGPVIDIIMVLREALKKPQQPPPPPQQPRL